MGRSPHSYCTNWIRKYGDGEKEMKKLSHQVGATVTVLRETYVHIVIDDADWDQIRDFGA